MSKSDKHTVRNKGVLVENCHEFIIHHPVVEYIRSNIHERIIKILDHCAMMCSDTENNFSYSQLLHLSKKTAVLFFQDNKVDPARILLRIAACLETNSIRVGQNYVNFLINHDMKTPVIFEKISRREI